MLQVLAELNSSVLQGAASSSETDWNGRLPEAQESFGKNLVYSYNARWLAATTPQQQRDEFG